MAYGSVNSREFINHTRWYVKVRWWFLGAIAVTGITTQFLKAGFGPALTAHTLLLVAAFAINGLFWHLAYKRHKDPGYYYWLALAQIVFDILFAGIAMYGNGGIVARTIILYAVPLFIAGALFGRHLLTFAIALAIASYDLVILLSGMGVLTPHASAQVSTGSGVVTQVLFYNTLFIMIGIIAKRALEHATKNLKEQRKELIALNQAKDDFISLASHQLRTPATGVKQYISMLLEGYAGEIPDQQKTFLKTAYDSNERQIQVINDMLKVAQLEAGVTTLKTKRSDIVKLLQATVDEHNEKLSTHKRTIKITAKHPKIQVIVDAHWMQMALENLIDSAEMYSNEGKDIAITVTKDSRHAIIRVKNEGIGIARKDIPKLFQKFARVNSSRALEAGGTGLGLFLTKKILDLHGAQLHVTSTVNKGSTFTLRVPLY